MEKLEEQESIVARILEHEATKLIGIIVAVIGVINYIIIPIKLQSQELENIKSNHLHTIEMNMNELKTLQEKSTKENNDEHKLIMEQLTKTATILDQHLKSDIK